MSLAKELAKPVSVIVLNAELRGLQTGAAVGLAVAVPALLLVPHKANPSDAPPLVAAANLAAHGAAAGLVLAATATAAKLVKCAAKSKGEGESCGGGDDAAAKIHKCSDAILGDAALRRRHAASAAGAAAGLALEAVRVAALAKQSGRCFYGLAFSKQTAREAFGFAVAGAAVAVGAAAAVGAVRAKLQQGKAADDEEQAPLAELEEGATAATAEGEQEATATTESVVAENVNETIEAAAAATSADA